MITPALDAWLSGRPANTVRNYRPAVLAWLDWLGKDPARATPRDASAYAAALAARYKPNSAGAKIAACASYHQHLLDAGLASRNPFTDSWRPPRPHHAASAFLSPADLRRLLLFLDSSLSNRRLRAKAVILLFLETGRRAREIAALRWSDLAIQPDGSAILTWAGGHQPLSPRAVNALLAWHEAVGWWPVQPASYLWRPMAQGSQLPAVVIAPAGHISAKQLRAIVHRAGQRVGLTLTPGVLRNTFAALYGAVGNPREAGRLLGARQPITSAPQGRAAISEFSAALAALSQRETA